MDFIIDQVNNYMNKAICRHAKKSGLEPNDVQIIFYVKDDGAAGVRMAEHYQPLKYEEGKEPTFKQVMGLKLDILNIATTTEFFIQQALADFCKSDDIDPDKISVMVVRRNEDMMLLYLYNNGDHVRKIAMEEIFDQSKLKMV